MQGLFILRSLYNNGSKNVNDFAKSYMGNPIILLPIRDRDDFERLERRFAEEFGPLG